MKILVPIPACSSDDGTPDIDGVKSIIERRHKIVKIPIHLMPEYLQDGIELLKALS